MSTLGSLMLALAEPGITPYHEQELTATRIQSGRTANQTALIELENLRRTQETAARMRQYYQAHPEELLGGGGGGPQSTISSLGPGGGPMTQQPFGPGGMGPPQPVPGGQDLSRYAGVSPQGGGPLPPDVAAQVRPTVTPRQSTLGSLQPPAPGQGQAPPDQIEALMRVDPDAAFQVMGQRFKLQEQRLGWGEKIAASIGRIFQGVHDQASLEQARDEVRQIDPKAAAALPQFYSKEAMEPVMARALDMQTAQTLKIQDLKAQSSAVQAQADLARARMSGRVATTDQYLKALGVRPGEETAEDMHKALALEHQDKQALSASHGTGQIVQTPQGMMRVNPRTGAVEPVQAPGGGPLYPKPTAEEQKAQSFGDLAASSHANAIRLEDKGLQPSLWAKVGEALPFGMGNYLRSEDRQKYEQAVRQFAQAWLRKTSGAAVSREEYAMTDTTYFPQPGDSQAVIAQKRTAREDLIKGMQAEGQQTGRQPSAAGRGASPDALKPVGEMSREELLAERDRLRQGGR